MAGGACPPGDIPRGHLVHPPMQQPRRQVKKLRVGVPQLPACPHRRAQLVHWQALFNCGCCCRCQSAAAATTTAPSIPCPVAAVTINAAAAAAAAAAGATCWLAAAAAGAIHARLKPAGQLLGDGAQEGLVLGGSQRGQRPQKGHQRLHSTAQHSKAQHSTAQQQGRKDTWQWLSAGWRQVSPTRGSREWAA